MAKNISSPKANAPRQPQDAQERDRGEAGISKQADDEVQDDFGAEDDEFESDDEDEEDMDDDPDTDEA